MWNNRNTILLVMIVFILMIYLLSAGILRTNAQQPVSAGFVYWCYVEVDFETTQHHIVSVADGTTEFAFGQNFVPLGDQPLETNIPTIFTVQPGIHDVGYIELNALDTPYEWEFVFTHLPTSSVFLFNLAMWRATPCDNTPINNPLTGETIYISNPAPVLDGTECQHEAIDSSTGLPYCYDPLENGVVPLPPAYSGVKYEQRN